MKSSSSSSNPLDGSDPLGGGSSDPLADPLSDPLSGMSVSDDPLSSMLGSDAGSKLEQRKQTASEASRQVTKDLHTTRLNTPWSIMKQQISRDYTVVGNITVGASSIREFAGSGVEDGSSHRKVDRYTKRLAGLERKEISDDKIELTQKEYAAHIHKLEGDLHTAWANDERVQSLKIAIQIAKLLADTNVPLFYPSIFVMVTDVLECFGDMVFLRLKNKAEEGLVDPNKPTRKKPRLPENFTAADVPTVAKETCRNWFYKTACIRELLPRIYVETALLKCFRFLADGENAQILARLGSIVRGVGDPLVSLYARAYVVVVGNEIAPHASQHTMGMVHDVLSSFDMVDSTHHQQEMKRCKISRSEYLHVMSPGLQWLLKSVGKSSNKETFQGLLQLYREKCNDSMVLKHIIDAFDASHYAHASIGMATLIRSAGVSCVPAVDLYAALGRQLVLHPPPEEQRLPLLNDVWKAVSKSDDIGGYIRCCSAWLEVIHRHYSERECQILLTDLTLKLDALNSELKEDDMRQLEVLLRGLIQQASMSGSSLLTSDHLLKILDFFKGSKKVELCKDVLDSFKSHKTTNDAVLIHTMFDIGRTLHDSVDSLSDDGEKRHIATLICAFIDKIDFGKDLEQQLSVYVECRSIFCNLDLVQDKLIMCVCALTVKAYRYMRGRHSKKTAAFSKACLAFCHITTPSISDVPRKLQLLLYCAQVSLLNQNLPQTDTFLKAAISLIPEMPTHEEIDSKRVHTEERLSVFLRSLLSLLVVAPGHPEHGPFYIVQGLLNALPRYSWQPTTQHQTKVYIDMLALLCTFAQRSFPYKIPYVESNDKLYGGTADYMAELGETITLVMQEIVKQLSQLGERPEAVAKANQAKLVLDLASTICCRMEMTPEVASFVVKLLELAKRNKGAFTRSDLKYMTAALDDMRRRVDSSAGASVLNPAIRALLQE